MSDIDRILRDHPDAANTGELRDLKDKMPESSAPGFGSDRSEIARLVSAQRKREHDRRAEPYPDRRGPDRFVITQNRDLSPASGLRTRMKAHPDGDDLPRWKGSSFAIDPQDVRFEP